MDNQATKAQIEQGSTTNLLPRCRIQVNSKWEISLNHKSLFIELNYHQGHGPHPYDPNNPEDQKLVELWRSKQNHEGDKNQYWSYEKIFTKSDPEKLACAKRNKLNYLMIYRNGLEIKI